MKRFDQWRSGPSASRRLGAVLCPRDCAPAAAHQASFAPSPTRPPPEAERWCFGIREAVAVFADAPALEAAVDAREHGGFDRAQLSVLGGSGATIPRLYPGAASLEDEPAAPRSVVTACASRVELEVGAGLGGLSAGTVAQHHAAREVAQIRQGGMVLRVGSSIRRRNSVRWRRCRRPAGVTCMRIASSFGWDRRRVRSRAPISIRSCTPPRNLKPGKPSAIRTRSGDDR